MKAPAMSDAPELSLWQLLQGVGFTATVGFAAAALRRAFTLGAEVALVKKAVDEQVAINAETTAALKTSMVNHYELKTVLASLPTREEMRQMLQDSRTDPGAPPPRPRRRPP
jgi:hypothetical protein